MTTPARRRSSPRGGSRGRTRGAIDVTVCRERGVSGPAGAVVARVAAMVLRSEGVRRASVSVALVGNATIRRLNARYLGRRRTTDVIAFAFAGAHGATIGDVYVAPAVARGAAAALGIPAREEILRLVVHGVLHALGYDHPSGESRLASPMWRRQEALLARALRVETP